MLIETIDRSKPLSNRKSSVFPLKPLKSGKDFHTLFSLKKIKKKSSDVFCFPAFLLLLEKFFKSKTKRLRENYITRQRNEKRFITFHIDIIHILSFCRELREECKKADIKENFFWLGHIQKRVKRHIESFISNKAWKILKVLKL